MLLTLVLISTFVTPIPDQQYHFPDENTANSNFHVVEFNDEGQPHDLKQQQALFDRIKKPDSATAELVIFVHGWHHGLGQYFGELEEDFATK